MSASPSPPSFPLNGIGGPRAEGNRALVLRYFDMWNSGRGAAADELLGPTYIEHAHPDFLGPAALRSIVPRVHAQHPDMIVKAEVVAVDSEFVAVRTVLEPEHLDGHPDGPRRGVALFRVADGKLAEQWSWYAPPSRQRAM
jgi:predicted SnoaL-like aldol condensation-catalyzing enzyme